MADETVGVRIDVDAKGAKSALTGVSGAFASFHTGLKQADAGIQKAQASLQPYGAALDQIGQVYNAVIGSTIQYANSVEDVTRATGASAEEASKFLYAAEQSGVGMDTLTKSLKTASANGIRPNIENIAALSEQYNDIQDPIERARFLTKTFGQSGADMAEFMERGAKGIKAMGDEAQALGLVLDQQAIDAAGEYEEAVRKLEARWKGLTVTVGNAAVPVLNEAAGTLDLLVGWNVKLQAAIRNNNKEVVKTSESYADYTAEMNRQASVIGHTINQNGDLVDQFGNIIESNFLLAESTFEVSRAYADGAQDIEDYRATQEQSLVTTEAAIEASAASSVALDALRMNIAGPVGEAYRQFGEQQVDLKTKAGELWQQITTLEGARYLTAEQKTELQTAREELGKVNDQMAINAEEQSKRVKQLVFDLAQQRAAADDGKVSDEELQGLTNLATNLGLVDEATKQVTDKYIVWSDALEKKQISFDQFLVGMEDIADTASRNLTPSLESSKRATTSLLEEAGRLDGKEVSMTVYTNFVAQAGGNGAGGTSGGGGATVNNVTVNANTNANADDIADAVVDRLRK